MEQKSYIAKAGTFEKKYYLIDAKDKVLGRVAAKAATILRGKHKKIYTPNVDTGDYVIIINADKIRVTGRKLEDKEYQYFTGYPSGRRVIPLGELMKKKPTQAMLLAVTRMIPNGPLGYKIRTNVRIYAGDKHPHKAQKPIPLAV